MHTIQIFTQKELQTFSLERLDAIAEEMGIIFEQDTPDRELIISEIEDKMFPIGAEITYDEDKKGLIVEKSKTSTFLTIRTRLGDLYGVEPSRVNKVEVLFQELSEILENISNLYKEVKVVNYDSESVSITLREDDSIDFESEMDLRDFLGNIEYIMVAEGVGYRISKQ